MRDILEMGKLKIKLNSGGFSNPTHTAQIPAVQAEPAETKIKQIILETQILNRAAKNKIKINYPITPINLKYARFRFIKKIWH